MKVKLGHYEVIKLDMEFIYAHMKESGITQVELAKRMGVSQPAISKVFSRGVARPKLLKRLAARLGVSAVSLVRGDQILPDDDTTTKAVVL